MELRRSRPEDSFHATKAGAGIAVRQRCSHGSPLLALQFIDSRGVSEETLSVLLPACVGPQLFGAVIGLIEASGGTEAAKSFVTQMLAAADETVSTVAAREAEQAEAAKHCCEAAFRTGGREHTCRNATDSPS